MSRHNRDRRRREAPGAIAKEWPEALLVLAVRIGEAPRVPPGYGTGDCRLCGHAVWISPRFAPLARRLGMKLVACCNRCEPPGVRRLFRR